LPAEKGRENEVLRKERIIEGKKRNGKELKY